jgi:membrane-associated phospholipid phosphatase
MKRFRFFKFLIQTFLILMAYLIGVSRVFDHRHFVADVVVGGLVGILFATHVWVVQLEKFDSKGNGRHQNRPETFPLN